MFLNEMNRKENSHKNEKPASTIEFKKQHIVDSDVELLNGPQPIRSACLIEKFIGLEP